MDTHIYDANFAVLDTGGYLIGRLPPLAIIAGCSVSRTTATVRDNFYIHFQYIYTGRLPKCNNYRIIFRVPNV